MPDKAEAPSPGRHVFPIGSIEPVAALNLLKLRHFLCTHIFRCCIKQCYQHLACVIMHATTLEGFTNLQQQKHPQQGASQLLLQQMWVFDHTQWHMHPPEQDESHAFMSQRQGCVLWFPESGIAMDGCTITGAGTSTSPTKRMYIWEQHALLCILLGSTPAKQHSSLCIQLGSLTGSTPQHKGYIKR